MTEAFRIGDIWESTLGHTYEITLVADGIATFEPRSTGAYWHRWPASRVGRNWKLISRDGQPAEVTHG
jgi:hypothetical protein